MASAILYDIISKARMSGRPEYYSGRGVTPTDLNDAHIEAIWQGIHERISPAAAWNYENMVRRLDSLTATDFLVSLFNLERNKWRFRKSQLSGVKGIAFNDEATAFATVAAVLTRAYTAAPDTLQGSINMRAPFLRRHGRTDPRVPGGGRRVVGWYDRPYLDRPHLREAREESDMMMDMYLRPRNGW